MAQEHDKVLDHTRLQLSALFDGELGIDEARFLQRRLEHDRVLAARWSRWQLAGDVLRGQATAAAPAGFAERVAGAIAAGPQAGAGARPRRPFWMPGAALAASVAALAMFMTRQAPEVATPVAPQAQVASVGQPRPAEALPAPATGDPQAPAPQGAAQVAAAAIAVAEVPRRAAERRSRAQQQRAAATRAVRAAAEPAQARLVANASASPAPVEPVGAPNPFAPDAAAGAIATRPWPRALLPHAGQAFSVGYSQLQPDASRFTRFEPFSGEAALLPEPTEPEDSP